MPACATSRAATTPRLSSPLPRREPSRFRGTQGTAVVGAFDMTAASTGASEKTLRRVGMPYEKVYVHVNNHAGGCSVLTRRAAWRDVPWKARASSTHICRQTGHACLPQCAGLLRPLAM